MKEVWTQILERHREKYPLMEPQDYGKLIFQSVFGAEHFLADEESALAFLQKEWSEMGHGASPCSPEAVGGGLCRFPLSACTSLEAVKLLAQLFVLTAQGSSGKECPKIPEAVREKLAQAVRLGIPGMEEWAMSWAGEGCPAVSHSNAYRSAYHPHYRLLRREYADYFDALLGIVWLMGRKRSVVIAIDGRCGSGKTSFAQLIGRLFPCNVLHMDDYYLPAEKRREDWRLAPGGNMDLERFGREVLQPARAGGRIVCRPYSCQKGGMEKERILEPCPLTVVEGSYSLHPLLSEGYDLKIFLTCSKETQGSRLQAREGSCFSAFEEQWIPMEERYFKQCLVAERSNLLVDTGQPFAN